MRIRKRYQNPLPPPDLSPALPRSTVPAAARGTTAAGKEGEATAAAAAAAVCAPGGGCGDGGGGKGLHWDGRTTGPSACPPPSARGAERGYLPIPGPRLLFDYSHHKVPKREQGREIGDAHRGWNMDALRCDSTGDATAPKSLGAEASEVSGGHGGGGNMLPSGAAALLAAAEAMMKCGVDEEGEFSLKKRRGGYHGRGRSLGPGAEEEQEKGGGENVVIEREMKQRRRPSKTRRRRTAASTSAAMVATGTVLTSAGTGFGASTATAGDGAGEKCDDMVVKEEGGDVLPVAAAALAVVGNRDSGSGKKRRRSPAVLMEGSRCSRVNGRGWRCCQQTLVGYSLCEHHLGKGRLRSVSSVRCNGRARKKEDVGGDHGAAAPPLPSPLRQQRDQVLSRDEEDEEEERPAGKRRRNKIGMAKARSIRSLLHQPVHPAPTLTIAAPEEPIFPSPSPQLQLHAQ